MDREFNEDEYNALIERLFNRFPSYQTVGGVAYHPGLEAMKEFDSRLGSVHTQYRTIHIAGTNGKGSVSNMLTSSLSAMGYKTALYTSPHLLDFRERARIVEGKGATRVRLIPREDVWEFCTKWWQDFDELGLSFFEITTSMAFWWFAKEGVDFAVIETGLGGRLDSTNIITPSLSVITNIGLDHCNILGDTLEKIAGEKAGIIKSGAPALLGESSPEIDPVFSAKAAAENAPLFFAERDFDWRDDSSEEAMLRLGVSKEEFESLLSQMDLQGCYQRKNLRTALAALSLMRRFSIAPSSGVNKLTSGQGSKTQKGQDALPEGVYGALAHTAQRTGFHGRWEKISDNPLTIIDIGHNVHGLKYNFSQLQRLQEEEGYDVVMVYGSVADKDYESVVKMIPRGAKVIFTNAQGSRALPAEKAREAFAGDCEDAFVCPRVEDAVALARKLSLSLPKPLIYIGGSTYVVSEALRAE